MLVPIGHITRLMQNFRGVGWHDAAHTAFAPVLPQKTHQLKITESEFTTNLLIETTARKLAGISTPAKRAKSK